MAINRHMTAKQRNNFRRIIAQLDKTKVESKIVKIVNQATQFLNEADVGWDTVGIFLLPHYVFLSQRRRAQRTADAAVKIATAIDPGMNGTMPLGKDGRALLKTALSRHPDWAMTRDYLGLDLASITKDEMIAVAQLLKMDERFLKLFADGSGTLVSAPEPTIVDIEELLASKEKVNGSV